MVVPRQGWILLLNLWTQCHFYGNTLAVYGKLVFQQYILANRRSNLQFCSSNLPHLQHNRAALLVSRRMWLPHIPHPKQMLHFYLWHRLDASALHFLNHNERLQQFERGLRPRRPHLILSRRRLQRHSARALAAILRCFKLGFRRNCLRDGHCPLANGQQVDVQLAMPLRNECICSVWPRA